MRLMISLDAQRHPQGHEDGERAEDVGGPQGLPDQRHDLGGGANNHTNDTNNRHRNTNTNDNINTNNNDDNSNNIQHNSVAARDNAGTLAFGRTRLCLCFSLLVLTVARPFLVQGPPKKIHQEHLLFARHHLFVYPFRGQ